MIGWTLCSGIGAPELSAPWIDWRLASEIEPFPRAVLQERFGYVPHADHNQGDPILWGDMETLDLGTIQGRGVPLPDLLVAGTPCQPFSVAGLRKGLEDSRGNLTLKFVEICHAIVDARHDGKLAVLWENVPGILSDKGNAFGALLGGLVGALDALPCPADGRWPGEGMVQGPRARAAWAVLDAQWFGVAQRRRRVFVVVDFGGACDPAKVLLEPDSLRGHPPARKEAGQGVAATLEASTGGGGGLGTDFEIAGGLTAQQLPSADPAHCLETTCNDYSRADGFNAVVPSHDPAVTLTARDRKGPLPEADLSTVVTHSLRGEGFDASEDGTGRGTPLVPVAFDCKGTEVQHDASGVSSPLRSMGHNDSHQNAGGHAAVAFDTTQITSPENRSQPAPGDPCHPVAAQAHAPAIAIQERAVSENPDAGPDGAGFRTDDTAYTLEARDKTQSVVTPWAVRRLTPTECARLQGAPDDHTAITYRNKPAADGPQYKGYGNSMAVPCVRWIIERIAA